MRKYFSKNILYQNKQNDRHVFNFGHVSTSQFVQCTDALDISLVLSQGAFYCLSLLLLFF